MLCLLCYLKVIIAQGIEHLIKLKRDKNLKSSAIALNYVCPLILIQLKSNFVDKLQGKLGEMASGVRNLAEMETHVRQILDTVLSLVKNSAKSSVTVVFIFYFTMLYLLHKYMTYFSNIWQELDINFKENVRQCETLLEFAISKCENALGSIFEFADLFMSSSAPSVAILLKVLS